jgi:glycosyltransferase involved in cell wall biosynthesis
VSDSELPQVTVVLCTYNRAALLERTVRAVLAQKGCELDLVVVDDGSPDDTPAVLASIDDPRLRVVRQANAGLSVARNSGLAAAEGDWVVFLDDDDLPEPEWLELLARPMGDPGVGITCVGSTAVDPQGDVICPLPVVPLPEPFVGVTGSYRAGTFAVRTELCRRAGGYLDGLGANHQFELFVRLLAETRREGLEVASTDRNVLRIERRPVDNRRSTNPHIMYDATSWIMCRHPVIFASQTVARGAFEGVLGASAARADDWRSARRHFWLSAKAEPRRRRGWQRYALAHCPPLGRRIWNRHSHVSYNPAAIGVLRQGPETAGAPRRELFLAWRYEQNPPEGSGAASGLRRGRWARRLAGRLARRWPGLVVSWGELVRSDDPVARMHQLALEAGHAPLLFVTPDRARTDPDRPLGPPSNPAHRREWTYDQFVLLLRSTGFIIQRHFRSGSRMAFLARRSGVLDADAAAGNQTV